MEDLGNRVKISSLLRYERQGITRKKDVKRNNTGAGFLSVFQGKNQAKPDFFFFSVNKFL